MTKIIEWISRGRKAQCPPNPEFPNGVEVDITNGAHDFCEVDLPYPAPECGIWKVDCHECNNGSIGITAAGRPDDPIKVKIPCLKGEIQ